MYNKRMIWWARLLVLSLMLVMVTIPARVVVRNILFEHFGLSQPWMGFFLQGDGEFSDALREQADVDETSDVSVQSDFEKMFPFQDEPEETEIKKTGFLEKAEAYADRYVSFVESLEGKIEAYCEEELLFYAQAVTLTSELEKAVGMTDFADSDVLQMQNGWLTAKEERVEDGDIQMIAEEVADFDDFLSELDIPFFYANAGSKVCPYDRQLGDYAEEYSNENGTALLNALAQRGVDTLDFRELMQADGLDWYDSYYKTDHHWKTETGLWAAKKLAEKLNESGKLAFDLSVFDRENYRFDTFDGIFLGSQGRKVTLAGAELESYTRILPAFETSFSLQIPSRSLNLTGDYEEVLYNEARLENIFSYSSADHLIQADAYHCIRVTNDPLVHIQNLQPKDNQGKKILLLQDSFSWYSSSFLACDIAAVDTIYLADFTGSVRTYIGQTRPDAVILMYYEGNIGAIDWNSHESNFDLR